MDILQAMRAFVRVVDSGSFTAAAASCSFPMPRCRGWCRIWRPTCRRACCIAPPAAWR
ncbi:LysR family transcriptional regulator [Azotobacter sp. CWF10]